jgi:site-specific recombinase XerC
MNQRDSAVVRLLIDLGCRLAEIAGTSLADVDLKQGLSQVLGKVGGRGSCHGSNSACKRALGSLCPLGRPRRVGWKPLVRNR